MLMCKKNNYHILCSKTKHIPRICRKIVAKTYGDNLPFDMQTLKESIPDHIWERNTQTSLSYLIKDILSIYLTYLCYTQYQIWYLWPIYWLLQGSLFFAVFNIGHDCVHGSFSENNIINALVGLLTLGFLCVPFQGFRKSHKIHHTFQAHPERDESWKPLCTSIDRESTVGKLRFLFRTQLPFCLFAYPIHLFYPHSHYDYNSKYFRPSDKRMLDLSNISIVVFVCLFVNFIRTNGMLMFMNLYIIPYFVFSAWLSVVSYLHHHTSHDKPILWYRGKEWNFLRGCLSTIDRDYGVFNELHHNIGTHVVHHIFPQIPHYNLKEATLYIKYVLGSHYREPVKCNTFIPFHLYQIFVDSLKNDHYVDPNNDVTSYRSNNNH